MEHLLRIRDLEAGYGGRPVLRGVCLDVAPGEMVAIIGANGAGKSTLLKAIFGLVKVSRGSVLFRGHEIQNRKPSDNVRDGLAYALQGSRVFSQLSVQDNLEVGGHTLRRDEVHRRVDEVLGVFTDLAALRRRTASTLSTGEQQMLALARCLMLKPVLLLADEPSLGLAPGLARTAIRALQGLNTRLGTSVLLVEQNVREALAVAHRVHVLRLGQVVVSDEPDRLTPELLREAFLG